MRVYRALDLFCGAGGKGEPMRLEPVIIGDCTLYFIADLRREFSGQRYITFWRAQNSNYAWPLSWAGRYSQEQIDGHGRYYFEHEGRSLSRFPVPCSIAEAMGVPPINGTIDGDAGPVVLNTASNRARLRRNAYTPSSLRTVRGTSCA